MEWQYDQKEMKLKCRTKVDDEKLVDDDKFIEDFIRQQFLKFYVYINKLVKNGPNIQSSQKRKHNHSASGKTQSSTSSNDNSSTDCYLLNLYL